MKKSKLFLLPAALLLAGGLVSCGEKGTEVTFGVGYTAAFDGSKGEIDATVVGAAFEKGTGKIIDARLDVMQIKLDMATVSITSKGSTSEVFTVVLKEGSGLKSKLELGADYGMAARATQGEFYQQAEAWADWTVGKTAEEVKSNTADVAGCSVGTDDFVLALSNAYANAKDAGTLDSSKLKVGVSFAAATVSGKSTNNSEAGLDFAGALTDGTKNIVSYCDTLAAELTGSEDADTGVKTYGLKVGSKYIVDGKLVSKRGLGAAYGMTSKDAEGNAVDDGLGYEKNCQAVDAALAGKTLEEVAAFDASAEVAGVSVSQKESLFQASKEAVAYSVKAVITDKPVAAK